MEVAENQYFDEAIHHRGTARCIPLTDVADYAQLAALRDERDRAVERIMEALAWIQHSGLDPNYKGQHTNTVPNGLKVAQAIQAILEGE